MESFKKGTPPKMRPAKVLLAQDQSGDVEYRIEGVTALNALSFLELMLYLNHRVLEIYKG
jgi:hypothetical protein